MEKNAIIEGTVKKVVFLNDENAFTVALLQTEEKPDPTTIVGTLGQLTIGETLRCTGEWVHDKRFGEQFRVSQYEPLLPSSEKGLIRFLSSGLIAGIGKAYAKRLVETFGMDTVRVIEQEPKKLRKVPGFGRKRIEKLLEGWQEHRQLREIMIFLQGLGISSTIGLRIYRKYDQRTISIVRENPYRLASDIHGIGFERADQIASHVGFDPQSAERAQAGIVYTLEQAAISEGHCFLTKEVLLRRSLTLLEIDDAIVETALETLIKIGIVFHVRTGSDQDVIYLHSLYKPERTVGEKLAVLCAAKSCIPDIKTEKAITWVQQESEITLANKQIEALEAALEHKVVVITGGPGTGKTTLVNCLIKILQYKRLNVLLAAPTGRAAKRLSEVTGEEACTIHRLLEFNPHKGAFQRHEGNPLEAEVIILDEVSMVDIVLMDSLLRAVPPTATLILVGDIDQLPSVGPGDVLRDIIRSDVIPTIRLEQIYRQSEQSLITTNAHAVNQGQMPRTEPFNSHAPVDFYYIQDDSSERIVEKIKLLIAERIPQRFQIQPHNIQVLAPMHKGILGIENLNRELQALLNPHGKPIGFGSRHFCINDKVMQIRNNYDKDVYNGDMGTVRSVDIDEKVVCVDFDGVIAEYDTSDIDELVLAYAISIHKSQGNEYDAVILPLNTEHYIMLQRNLLYTGITRGKKLVILVGAPRALQMAVENNRVARRNTNLQYVLRESSNLLAD